MAAVSCIGSCSKVQVFLVWQLLICFCKCLCVWICLFWFGGLHINKFVVKLEIRSYLSSSLCLKCCRYKEELHAQKYKAPDIHAHTFSLSNDTGSFDLCLFLIMTNQTCHDMGSLCLIYVSLLRYYFLFMFVFNYDMGSFVIINGSHGKKEKEQ